MTAVFVGLAVDIQTDLALLTLYSWHVIRTKPQTFTVLASISTIVLNRCNMVFAIVRIIAGRQHDITDRIYTFDLWMAVECMTSILGFEAGRFYEYLTTKKPLRTYSN